jgi:elongation factor P
MNVEDYNQIELQKSVLDSPDLMKEGEVVTVIINTEDNATFSRYACKCYT